VIVGFAAVTRDDAETQDDQRADGEPDAADARKDAGLP